MYMRMGGFFFLVHDITQENKRCHLTKVKLLLFSTLPFHCHLFGRTHTHTTYFWLCLNRCFHLNKWILFESGDNFSTNVKLINHYNPFPSTSKVSPVKNNLFETDANHHIQTIHSMSNWLDSHLYSSWCFICLASTNDFRDIFVVLFFIWSTHVFSMLAVD